MRKQDINQEKITKAKRKKRKGNKDKKIQIKEIKVRNNQSINQTKRLKSLTNNNTDRTHMRRFSFTTTLRQNTRNSFGLLTQGYCERKTPKACKDDIQCSICIVFIYG